MAVPQIQAEFDLDAFLQWEETQPERHEYLAGEVFPMSGGSDTHYTILGNTYSALKSALQGSPCRTFVSGMKLCIERADAMFYPDVFVTCDPRDRAAGSELFKQHPSLVVEILSPSTAAYDRGYKFDLYQQIDSLQEYLLIEQDRLHADLFRKNSEGLWVLHPAPEGSVIELASLGVSLPLASLYADVLNPPV